MSDFLSFPTAHYVRVEYSLTVSKENAYVRRGMEWYIALFRGINVGGHNTIRMKELRDIFETAGYVDVKSYIQSGNIVFRSSGTDSNMAMSIRTAVEERFGFDPAVLILPLRDFDIAIRENPYEISAHEQKTVHLFFLSKEPSAPDTAGMNAVKTSTERFELTRRVLYLHAPDGIGRSKLAARIEKLVGVPTTARNLGTVMRVREMIHE